MGLPMCANLVKAGHAVRAYDVVAANLVDRAVAAGAARAESVADCVAGRRGRGHDAALLAARAQRLLRRLRRHRPREGAARLLVDSSTIDPLTAREVAFDALARGLAMVDAPVSGGTAGAEAGTLTFMVGGSDAGTSRPRGRSSPAWARTSCTAARAATARSPRSATT